MKATKKLLAVAVSFGLGAVVSTAFGQYGGGGGFRDGYHSSTLAEGIQRGRADLVRSRGLADLYHAQAADQFEQAKQKHLDNRVGYIEYRQVLERYQRERRNDKRKDYTERRKAREKRGALKNSSIAQDISWPKPLMMARYAPHRREIQALTNLYSQLDQNEGVRVGLRTSIVIMADRIKIDEQANKLTENDSLVVREFVTQLYQANGNNVPRQSPDDVVAQR